MEVTNTVNFVLQGKGGIGKSLVGKLLAEWFRKIAAPVKCYDLDQENTTLAHYKALDVTHLSVMKSDRTIDPKQFDLLMVDILESPESQSGMNYVIDTGANTFSPLMAYLISNGAFDVIRDAGKTPIIHSIVGGGDTLQDTAEGFESVAEATCTPKVDTPVELVVWENEHFGPLVTAGGKHFTDTKMYGQFTDRVKSNIVLKARASDTFGDDVRKMNTARLTLDEVLASPTFNVMERNRIKRVYSDVFSQLDSVAW
ncbi:P-loop NTPase family protein [Burkholderia vietnamiensis]|uniref:hypothetical protein n=1 Tax=Burkholderia vietnamiensis TaxID=60552 RepID=UPI001CF44D50|nr:hypothetical protein [Burkholderia vietnamiensis]MCA8270383.1 hypothetical protein [Burkholderia vietnamiensis]